MGELFRLLSAVANELYDHRRICGWSRPGIGLEHSVFFNQPYAVDAPWLTQKQFMNLAGNMTDKIVAEMNLQPTIDAVWQQRQLEDYNGKNVAARDHMRSWYHTRAFDHVSLESMMEGAGDGQGNPAQDIPDSDAEFEQEN